jgi:DNA-binding CsgD family transcriptional regulator
MIEAGDLAGAEEASAAALASCREIGDLANLGGYLRNKAILELRAGRADQAAAHLCELLTIVAQTGLRSLLITGLDCCGHLCAATGRPAEAVTVWTAMTALPGSRPIPDGSLSLGRREEVRRQLGPDGTRAAQERGAAMSLAAVAEYALMLATQPAPDPVPGPAADPDQPSRELATLSPRERELVTLIAQGRTDAQIAAQLYITVRTVGSHLDRIRDKTGCRRRADLTRLALGAGLV